MAQLLLLLIMMVLTATAFADGTTISADKNMVFVNEKIVDSGFTVTKSVITAKESYSAPKDAIFGFTLYAIAEDDTSEPAAGLEYILLNASNGTVINCYYRDGVYYDYTAAEAKEAGFTNLEKVDRTTSETGGFSLKAGQTAKFSDRTTGERFAVVETNTGGEGFSQIQPAEGKEVYVVVKQTGFVEIVFVNQYEKDEPPPVSNDPGTVQIFNYYMTVPDYEHPMADTSITLTLDGMPWADASCSVYSMSAGGKWEFTETRSTDENGVLILQGNQKAIFTDVTAYSTVTADKSLPNTYWKDVGDTFLSCTVESGGTHSMSFTSRLLAFGVSKSVKQPESGDEIEVDEDYLFQFTLTDGDGVALENVKYYLYGSDNKPVDNTLRSVGTGGVFKLKDGETAIFVGMDVGDSYIVTEGSESEFKQVTPVDGVPYKGVVMESPFELPFTNEAIVPTGSLSVNWNIINEFAKDENKKVPVSSFTFTIYSGSEDSKTPLINESYRVGGTYFTTDSNGQFTLSASETAVFEFLPLDKSYMVQEIEPTTLPTAGATLTEEHNFMQSGSLSEDGLNFTFVNHYGVFADLKVKTVDSLSPDTVTLVNTEYTLERLLSDGTVDSGFDVRTLSSDGDGFCHAGSLSVGYKYRLTQTKTQEYYEMISSPVCFEIDLNNSDAITAQITQNVEAPLEASIAAPTADERAVLLTIQNELSIAYQLPKSGGIGTVWYTISGLLMVSGACVYGYTLRHRRKRRGE